MAFFTRMTSETVDKNKKNVVLMGRRTWDCIPPKFKPLTGRINFVMSRAGVDVEGNKDCYSFGSLEEVIDKLENGEFKEQYENVWVIGGSYIYEVPK
jgi:dihydrofolate reductase